MSPVFLDTVGMIAVWEEADHGTLPLTRPIERCLTKDAN
jgi:hypothetical protein